MSENTDLNSKLEEMRKNMRRDNWVFHFTRNRFSHTQYYYHRLIALVGYEKWKNISPEIRRAWDGASQNFDQQYGMVKAWVDKAGEIFEPQTDSPEISDLIQACKAELAVIHTNLRRIKENPEWISQDDLWEQFFNNLPSYCDKDTLRKRIMEQIEKVRMEHTLTVCKDSCEQLERMVENLNKAVQEKEGKPRQPTDPTDNQGGGEPASQPGEFPE